MSRCCRRRILRHLYSRQLRSTYLLGGCKQKFIDALLAVARIDMYMPEEDIILEGDYVNELFMVVSTLIRSRHLLSHTGCRGAVHSHTCPCCMLLWIAMSGMLRQRPTTCTV